HEGRSVQSRLYHGNHPRCRAAEDVEIEGQCCRSARHLRPLWNRCRSVCPRTYGRSGDGYRRFRRVAGVLSGICDEDLECRKVHLEQSKPTLLYVFESSLRLLHPFMPFITEELWQNLPHKGQSIVIAPYPEFDARMPDEQAESQTGLLQEIIVKVRNIRSEMN